MNLNINDNILRQEINYQDKTETLNYLNQINDQLNINKMNPEQLNMIKNHFEIIREIHLQDSVMNSARKYFSWSRTYNLDELMTKISLKITNREEKIQQKKNEIEELDTNDCDVNKFFRLKSDILNGISDINKCNVFSKFKDQKVSSEKYLFIRFKSDENRFEISKEYHLANSLFLKLHDASNFAVNLQQNKPIYAKIAKSDGNFVEPNGRTHQKFKEHHQRTIAKYALAEHLIHTNSHNNKNARKV